MLAGMCGAQEQPQAGGDEVACADLPLQVVLELRQAIKAMGDNECYWEGSPTRDDVYDAEWWLGGECKYSMGSITPPRGGWLVRVDADVVGDDEKEQLWLVIPPMVGDDDFYRDVIVCDARGRFLFRAPFSVLFAKKWGRQSFACLSGTCGVDHLNHIATTVQHACLIRPSGARLVFTRAEVALDPESAEPLAVQNLVQMIMKYGAMKQLRRAWSMSAEDAPCGVVGDAPLRLCKQSARAEAKHDYRIVAIADLIVRGHSTWSLQHGSLMAALRAWSHAHADAIAATKQYSCKQVLHMLQQRMATMEEGTSVARVREPVQVAANSEGVVEIEVYRAAGGYLAECRLHARGDAPKPAMPRLELQINCKHGVLNPYRIDHVAFRGHRVAGIPVGEGRWYFPTPMEDEGLTILMSQLNYTLLSPQGENMKHKSLPLRYSPLRPAYVSSIMHQGPPLPEEPQAEYAVPDLGLGKPGDDACIWRLRVEVPQVVGTAPLLVEVYRDKGCYTLVTQDLSPQGEGAFSVAKVMVEIPGQSPPVDIKQLATVRPEGPIRFSTAGQGIGPCSYSGTRRGMGQYQFWGTSQPCFGHIAAPAMRLTLHLADERGEPLINIPIEIEQEPIGDVVIGDIFISEPQPAPEGEYVPPRPTRLKHGMPQDD